MPEDSLTFVSLRGDFATDTRATNKVVRAHVMRRYKRQQQNTKSPSRRSRQKAQTHSPDSSHSTHHELSPRRSQSLPRFAKTWLDGELDPFSCLPISVDRRIMTLLQQNAALPIRTSVHSDPSCQYRELCCRDPAWLFMHLYYAACRFSKASGEATNYLLQSTSAISTSIDKSPRSIDDSTIAAVACLANIENLDGDVSHAMIHMNGLMRMVSLKGGLSKLGIRGILRRIVLWSDLLTSLNSGTAPLFPFAAVDKPYPLWNFTPGIPQAQYKIPVHPGLSTITTSKRRTSFTDLLLSLHELSVFLNSVDCYMLPWDACYPDRVYEVEHDILVALFDDTIIAECTAKVALGSALLNAALLFIYTNLRGTPVGGTIRQTLVSRLDIALGDLNLSSLSEEFVAEMLWITAVGTCAATNVSQATFTDMAREICAREQIRSWAEAVELLKSTPALLDANMAACMTLWELE